MNRREVLIGIGLAGATATAPVAGATLAKAADRRTWTEAVSGLRVAQAELRRFDALLSAAYEAADAACPRRDEFFSRYGMGIGWDRERNVRQAYTALMIERAEAVPVTAHDAKQASAVAERIVDEFEAWCARYSEAFREYDALEKRFEQVVDERDAAQKALLATDAPDREALRFKIELLADMMNEADADDAKHLTRIREDALRLLEA